MKQNKNVIQVLQKLLQLIYPCRCPFCDAVLPFGKNGLCKSCENKQMKIEAPFCMKCGKAITKEEKQYCEDCEKKEHSYTRGRGLFEYKAEVKESIARFKYHNRREYANFYVEELIKAYKKQIEIWGIDVIVPVPLHPKKKRKRGYNQAEIIAKKLGKRLDIPVETTWILRVKYTKPQKELSSKERSANLKNAFEIKKYNKKFKTVLIIDDIYTTGSTIDRISQELKKQEVEKVYFLTLAIGRGY